MKSLSKENNYNALIDKIYNDIPSFSEVFDEESFYLFAFLFTAITILVAFILSRFITIKPVD